MRGVPSGLGVLYGMVDDVDRYVGPFLSRASGVIYAANWEMNQTLKVQGCRISSLSYGKPCTLNVSKRSRLATLLQRQLVTAFKGS